MLIDEMIKYISEYITNSEVSEQIIVALKAGKVNEFALYRSEEDVEVAQEEIKHMLPNFFSNPRIEQVLTYE